MSKSNLKFDKKAFALIEQAVALSQDEQIAFLERACAGDTALFESCRSILDQQVNDEEFMSLVYQDFKQPTHQEYVGTVIGNYSLVKKIGKGGMADVYLARRSDGIHDELVALKIIRGWGDADELIARMKRERKILSRFRHANIATFLDGGSSQDGRPYFVLEYIEGKPITEYCRENNLDLRARLMLFVKVCSAVYAAHAKLILHRDLKPGNILVTESGEPKLLDFGIAKIIDEDEGLRTMLTQLGSPMTPQYASPEQIQHEPLTVASDQYSLGVLLYELLTDQLPYDVSKTNPYRVVCESTILVPSVRLARSAKDRRSHPDKRRTKQLKGALDAIVMKALHRQAELRYSSVNELSVDIGRYLQQKTVMAQKSSFRYRLVQFIKRNRRSVALSSGFACVLLAVAITQQARILKERNQAIFERDKFEQTQDFLLGLFELSDPESNLQDSITAREILERGVKSIQDRFADQPKIRGLLLFNMGWAYQKLKLYDTAFALQQESLALQREFSPDRDEPLAVTLNNLALILSDRGEYREAEQLGRESLEIFHALKSPSPANLANAYTTAGVIALGLQEVDTGIEHLKLALQLRTENPDVRDVDIVMSYSDICAAYIRKADYEQALKYNNLALEKQNQNPDRGIYYKSSIYNQFGVIYWGQGKTAEAAGNFQKALELRIELLGDELNPSLAELYTNLGYANNKLKDFSAAEAYFGKSLEIAKTTSKPWLEAFARNGLGFALHRMKRFEESLAHIQKAYDIRKRLYENEDNNDFALSYMNFGEYYAATGDLDQAADYYEKAIAIRSRVFGPDHEWTRELRDRLQELMQGGNIQG